MSTQQTGCEGELTRLLAELQPGRVVTLAGPGGIGESGLAAEAERQQGKEKRGKGTARQELLPAIERDTAGWAKGGRPQGSPLRS